MKETDERRMTGRADGDEPAVFSETGRANSGKSLTMWFICCDVIDGSDFKL